MVEQIAEPVVRPSRAVTRSRSCSAALREKVSASTCDGSAPRRLDAVDDRLDQRGGLAGAGAGEHEERAALVVDDALLVVVEHGRLRGRGGTHQAVGGPRAHGRITLPSGGRQ